jgi:hypothetical protein
VFALSWNHYGDFVEAVLAEMKSWRFAYVNITKRNWAALKPVMMLACAMRARKAGWPHTSFSGYVGRGQTTYPRHSPNRSYPRWLMAGLITRRYPQISSERYRPRGQPGPDRANFEKTRGRSTSSHLVHLSPISTAKPTPGLDSFAYLAQRVNLFLWTFHALGGV